jgi:adenylosuccinate lyase
MTKDLISIFDGLHINYKAIEKNLTDATDKLSSQKILSALVKNDIDRDEAYRSVQDLTFENLSTKEIVTKLSEKFKIDSNLILDFIEKETSLSNDEDSFNNKFK